MSDGSSPLIVSRERGIVRLRFNRPQVLNALDREAARAFRDICRTLAEDRSVRVLVLRGDGRFRVDAFIGKRRPRFGKE